MISPATLARQRLALDGELPEVQAEVRPPRVLPSPTGKRGPKLTERTCSCGCGRHLSAGNRTGMYREAEAEARAEALEEAALILIGAWDDGEQGPPRSEIEQYAEIVLLRYLARTPPEKTP